MENLELWIPAGISVLTLVINLVFYMFVQPRLSYKWGAKESLRNASCDMLKFLSEVVSYEDFAHVPTEVRNYSLRILLHFKDEKNCKGLETALENVYQEVKKRKKIEDDVEIEKWNKDFRETVRVLRRLLAKESGGL